ADIERVTRNQVPVERLQVTEVEDDAMPFRNRSIIQRVGSDELKQTIRGLPGLVDSPGKFAPSFSHSSPSVQKGPSYGCAVQPIRRPPGAGADRHRVCIRFGA